MERKIIVEGMNLSGKTSVCDLLEKQFTDCDSITIHGYYYPEVVERFSREGKIDYENMTKYGRERLISFLGLLNHSLDDFIFNRFHLTEVVYLKLFHNLTEHYHGLERELNKSGVYLVLLDMDDETLKKRLAKREQEGKTGVWDKDWESLVKKRDMYRWAFENSQVKNKILIDTSKFTIEGEVEHILKQVGYRQ